MLKDGHVGLTLALVAPLAVLSGFIFPKPTAAVVFAGGMVGSNIPDMDTQTQFVKHRGFTHTIWFSIIGSVIGAAVFLAIFAYLQIDSYIEIGQTTQMAAAVLFGVSFGFGIITHLLGDVITPRGVKPFDPVSPREVVPIKISEKKYVWEIANASNPLLNKGFSLLGVVVVMGSVYVMVNF
jgi:inner membrane protein